MLYQSLRRASLAASLLAGLAPWAVPAARADGPTLTTLHAFSAVDNTGHNADGSYFPALVQGADGGLYGVSTYDGPGGGGVVYRVNADGTGFRVLHTFAGGAADGANPEGLLAGRDGALYGTTATGGANQNGTVFRLNTDGTGFTLLHSFTERTGQAEGFTPEAGLAQGPDGTLYGTTLLGGTGTTSGVAGDGTVYRVNTDGTGFATLHDLNGATEGASPDAPLTVGSDGFLYGTTTLNGGTAFRVGTDGAGFAVLHAFSAVDNGGHNADGNEPFASGLTEGGDGFFYGTTRQGGAHGLGTIYRVRGDGSDFGAVYSFYSDSTEGAPAVGLTLRSGQLYGLATLNAHGTGSVFRINRDGTGYTDLHDFQSATEGTGPQSPLALGIDGNLYGTASGGGANGNGTVFRLALPAPPLITHLLWSNPDGKAAFWNVAGDGSLMGLVTYGPFTDSSGGLWHATALATGPDGVSHILWNSAGGQVALWNVGDNGTATVLAGFGPYTDGSASNLWRAAGLSVGPDGVMHLLWTNPDHKAAFWNVTQAGAASVLAGYGPFTDGSSPWDAVGVSTGPDNVSHLLWDNADGHDAFWSVSDTNGSATALAGYGPYTDGAAGSLWGAVGISTGPDNVSHLLWDNADGKAAFWAVSSGNGSIGGVTGYGPFTDGDGPLWAATGLTTGPDNVSRLLWNNADGKAALWSLDGAGSPSAVFGYGPYTDGSASNLWSAVGVSAGP